MRRKLLAVGTAFIASSCAFGAYVTDGLVLRYDAIDNAGVGTHSDSPSVWKDLSGNNNDLTLPGSGLTVGADTITFDHATGTVSGISCLSDASGTPELTLEVVCAATDSFVSTTSARTMASNPRISIYFRQVGAQHLVGGIYHDGSNRQFAGAPVRCCGWNNLQFIRQFHTYSITTKSSGGSVAVDGSDFAKLQSPFYNAVTALTDILTVGSESETYKIKAVRLYSRKLSCYEAAQNAAEDEARFSIRPVDANGNANAFDDAAFYFRGARQASNPYLDNYEFANALYIGSAAEPAGDTFDVSGAGRNNIIVETMDVPAPYAGKTLRNRSVVHFKQPYTLEDMSKVATSRIRLYQPVAATNKAAYTVMLRFKVESRTDPAQDATTKINVLQLGYAWSGQSGLDLQLCGPADDLYVRAYHGSNVDQFTDMQNDSAKTLRIGEWIDMALTVNGRVNRLYYKTESGTWYEGARDADVALLSADYGLYALALGGDASNSGIGANIDSAGNPAFRGWYQQVAVWDRALTRDEVLNAFCDGCADGDDWKIGVANDMSLEFAGSGAANVGTVNDWRNMNGELAAANSAVNVNFDLDAATFAKTRTFKFKTTSFAASGTFDLAVNGRTVAEDVASVAGQSAAVTVPGAFFASGANTLTVTRTDSNAGKMEIDCMSLVALEGDVPVSSVVDGDPFAGAYRWYRNDGAAFRDVLRTAYPNSSAHKWTVNGPSDNVSCSTVSVVCPYRGVTLPDEECMYLSQPSYTDGSGVIYGKGGSMYTSIFPVSNTVAHTAFLRFKLDSFQNPTNCIAVLYGTGYDWTGSRGVGLSLRGNDPENLYMYLSGGKTNIPITDTQNGEAKNRIAQGKWIDLAVVVSNNYGHVYACVEGGDFQDLGSHFFGGGGEGTPAAASGMYIGYSGGRSATSWSADSSDTTYFRGWVHQAAVWTCALSEKDVKAVFGFPSPDVVRIGVENGSSAEFHGSGATAYSYPANADFRDAPNVIAAGGSLTLTFDLPADEVKNQLLKIAAAPESVAATFTVRINGRDVVSYDNDDNATIAEFSVAPGDSASFGVIAEYLRSGANTLTITRTDSNVGAFSVDALSFGNGGKRVRIGKQGLMLIVQ